MVTDKNNKQQINLSMNGMKYYDRHSVSSFKTPSFTDLFVKLMDNDHFPLLSSLSHISPLYPLDVHLQQNNPT